MRVADYIVEVLEKNGITQVFTVTGGGAIFLCDAVGRAQKIKYIACHHEQAASMAAESYSRVKNDLAMVLVTSGPGATNAITGVAGCWLDHVPQLVISGQVFSGQMMPPNSGLRTKGVQEINIVDMVKPITKYAVTIDKPEDIRLHLEKAIHLAKSGRPGPVWLDIPANIQNAQVNPAELIGYIAPLIKDEPSAELLNQVEEVVSLLSKAKRPLIHIGQGIRISRAERELFELIEKFNIPFVTARNGNDLTSYDHPLYAGHPGTFAQRGANFAVQTSDFYLAIGTRLCLAQTGYNAKDYARNAKVVMVDIDRAELEKDTVPIFLKIQSDAKIFLNCLTLRLQNEALLNNKWESWVEKCSTWKEKYPVNLPEYSKQQGSINSYYFIDLLSKILNVKDTVVTDMGFAFQNTHQCFKIKKGQRVFTNGGLASMGWGLPAAIGACVANECHRTICISGEGGFMMTSHEMATVMHHKLPIKLFILNNGGYLTIKQTQEMGFEGRLMGSNAESGISFPDFLEMGIAHGFNVLRLSSHEDLEENLISFLSQPGPGVCEIMMDQDQIQGPKSINRRNTDGTIKQTPLEDSFPFLDEAEITDNMNIINALK